MPDSRSPDAAAGMLWWRPTIDLPFLNGGNGSLVALVAAEIFCCFCYWPILAPRGARREFCLFVKGRIAKGPCYFHVFLTCAVPPGTPGELPKNTRGPAFQGNPRGKRFLRCLIPMNLTPY
jgi:hypothetical protein